MESAHALASLRGLGPRVTEAEGRLAEVASRLSGVLDAPVGAGGAAAAGSAPALGGGVTSLPALSAAVRSLERRHAGRVDAAVAALDTLAGALGESGRIKAEATANPLKGKGRGLFGVEADAGLRARRPRLTSPQALASEYLRCYALLPQMQPLCFAPGPAAISAAMNNPVVVAIEKKLEAVRAELLAATSTMLDDLRREQQQL